ncbi:MAG: UDP-N-acetylmuramate dehydrogenase [Microlunatus sp.]|nr:UDP-N-acetylmuramate dehydrogenase [Microlunatus sp.]
MSSASLPPAAGRVTSGDSCETTPISLGPTATATALPTDKGAAVPDPRLSRYTTLRVGGRARRLVVATTEAELVAAVRDVDHTGEPVLVLGGGSNVLVGDHGCDGTVVKVETVGVTADVSACGGATVTVAAGEDWDRLVATAVAQQWSGIEALSGIPGLVGGTPIQNVGAYGCEVAQTIAGVRTLDRVTGRQVTFAASDCGFGYRTSRFKSEPGRYLVLDVTFQFPLGSLSAPVRYAELARRLGVSVGTRVPAVDVRQTVLELRTGKGMVLNPDDYDTWSAGSFFTNPILATAAAGRLPADAPRYPRADGLIKTSAAWLIEHAGYGKGYGGDLGRGRARLSTKHTLALTNRGDATAEDLLELAREVQSGVKRRFGVTLVPEPVLIGCAL